MATKVSTLIRENAQSVNTVFCATTIIQHGFKELFAVEFTRASQVVMENFFHSSMTSQRWQSALFNRVAVILDVCLGSLSWNVALQAIFSERGDPSASVYHRTC